MKLIAKHMPRREGMPGHLLAFVYMLVGFFFMTSIGIASLAVGAEESIRKQCDNFATVSKDDFFIGPNAYLIVAGAVDLIIVGPLSIAGCWLMNYILDETTDDETDVLLIPYFMLGPIGFCILLIIVGLFVIFRIGWVITGFVLYQRLSDEKCGDTPVGRCILAYTLLAAIKTVLVILWPKVRKFIAPLEGHNEDKALLRPKRTMSTDVANGRKSSHAGSDGSSLPAGLKVKKANTDIN